MYYILFIYSCQVTSLKFVMDCCCISYLIFVYSKRLYDPWFIILHLNYTVRLFVLKALVFSMSGPVIGCGIDFGSLIKTVHLLLTSTSYGLLWKVFSLADIPWLLFSIEPWMKQPFTSQWFSICLYSNVAIMISVWWQSTYATKISFLNISRMWQVESFYINSKKITATNVSFHKYIQWCASQNIYSTKANKSIETVFPKSDKF